MGKPSTYHLLRSYRSLLTPKLSSGSSYSSQRTSRDNSPYITHSTSSTKVSDDELDEGTLYVHTHTCTCTCSGVEIASHAGHSPINLVNVW